MNNNKSDQSRRKLLKSIAASSGAVIAGKSLPENWSRPVVDSVLLPAHAQTSPGVPPGPGTPPGSVPVELAGYYSVSGLAQSDDGLLDVLIPNANAAPSDLCFYVGDNGGGVMQIKVNGRVYVGLFTSLPFDTTLIWLNDSNFRIQANGDVVNGSMVGNVIEGVTPTPYSAPKSSIACSLEGSNPPGQAPLVSIQLQKGYTQNGTGEVISTSNPLVMKVGDVQYVTAWGVYQGVPGLVYIGTQVLWKSNDNSIASMSILQLSSNVTAKSPGTTSIEASLFGVVGTATVIVEA